MYRTIINCSLFCLLGASCLSMAQAPTHHRLSQPIEIQSNTLHIDHKIGRTVYEGNVEARFDGRLLKAARLTLLQSKTKPQQIIAEGSPASIETLAEEALPATFGQALRIVYFPDQDTVELREQALLRHAGDVIKSALICYDFNHQVLTSRPQQSRTEMVILPRKGATHAKN